MVLHLKIHIHLTLIYKEFIFPVIQWCSCSNNVVQINRVNFKGEFCEEDINECELSVPRCSHGICVNNHGGFQCYCMPGYTGEFCNVDFDECLSQPCKHNATCINKINNFECVCTPGYEGN